MLLAFEREEEGKKEEVDEPQKTVVLRACFVNRMMPLSEMLQPI